MEIVLGDYVLRDVEDKILAVKEIQQRTGHNDIDAANITRVMGAFDRHGNVCGYFLTCLYLGIKSFHGFKFVTGELATQMKMARKYIELEQIKFSAYRTKPPGIILKRLGFKVIHQDNGIVIVQC